ncbi:MAG: class I SAM-dependent methyltransferase [Chitinophagaceae bacterium]|nr:class I SAM-dependent methyltransferase [Chitinophagaceae bacterium]
MNTNLITYYKERAKEYERIYDKPERRDDLLQVIKILQQIFTNKTILEIACGTGYWTERIAKTAKSIVATDINDAVIEIAKTKNYFPAQVEFRIEDIFNFPKKGTYDALFGGFIWSHIKIEELKTFLIQVHKHVTPGGIVVFIDNKYVEGSSLPITETDELGNIYQTRTLENGSTHKVLKNFPNQTFIQDLIKDYAEAITFHNLKHYWILEYKTRTRLLVK